MADIWTDRGEGDDANDIWFYEYIYLFEEKCINKNLLFNEFWYLKSNHFISIFKSNYLAILGKTINRIFVR